MIHEVLPVGLLQCNCSILGDEGSREAIVVDPGADIARIVEILGRHRLTVRQIVVTHAHFDHLAGAAALRSLTGAPILYNQNDLDLARRMAEQPAWVGLAMDVAAGPAPDLSVGDGDTLAVTGITGTVLHTPGHSPGSICLYVPAANLLLAGDTLFAGGVGRTDFPGGDAPRLLRSIRGSLMELPDATAVIPGHGAWTTIGEERATNPFLR